MVVQLAHFNTSAIIKEKLRQKYEHGSNLQAIICQYFS